MLATIPVDLIENGQRLRDISEATVASLVNSIADVGLLNPITVYPRQLYRGGVRVDGYGLIAGLHRKTAMERLGLAEIEANILDLPDLERQIAECDENLCAPQLSPSERARFTKRRKEAYEALHPETKHGANYQSGQFGHTDEKSFVEATAEATGASLRTVRRAAELGEKICDEALDLVKGTRFDTQTYLNSLKRLSHEDQVKQVKSDVAVTKKPSQLPSLASIQRVNLDADIRFGSCRR
jgi:ParB family chromosome partitioning protein